MKMNKKESRLRRAKKTRAKIRELNAPRLCVCKSLNHIYAQIISADGANVIVSASTVTKENKKAIKKTGGIDAAKKIGTEIAAKAKKADLKKVAFDRSGYRFHGRIKALADAAREGGLEF